MTRKTIGCCALVAALTLPASADAVATAASATTIPVDVREGVVAAVTPAAIGYSPRWSGVTNEGTHVVLELIPNPEVSTSTASTLATLAADAEGAYAYTPAAGAPRYVRLVHRVYDGGGAQLGQALVRDVAFGWRGAAAGTAFADTREGSFQEAARVSDVVGLAYSTRWEGDCAATVSISAVQTHDTAGRAIASPETNLLFSAAAIAEGTREQRLRSGGWRLLLTLADASGNPLCEPYHADYFKRPKATAVLLR